MVGSTRTLIPLLIIFLLLTVCWSADSEIGNSTTSTSTIHSLARLTQRLSPAIADVCPKQLRRCITPQAMRAAYGIDSLVQRGFTGKGQTVIDLVSFGSPTLQQDMKVFNQKFNLPPIDLQVISPLNIPEFDPHQDKQGWAQETELDVEVIHALAPGAKVIVLQSPVAETEGIVGLPEYRQLQQYIITHRLGNIVSQSWGTSELTLGDPQCQQELQKWNTVLQQGTTKYHITYFSSSGDNGATNPIDINGHLGRDPSISFATNSPWVTSVGGTSLKRTGSDRKSTRLNSSHSQ